MNKRAYIQENKEWLIAKSKEEGVKALPKGIYYKVLGEGDQSSAQPRQNYYWEHIFPSITFADSYNSGLRIKSISS